MPCNNVCLLLCYSSFCPPSCTALSVLFSLRRSNSAAPAVCEQTGMTDPRSTLGWGIVDFDWSNSKGTGSADGWGLSIAV